MPEINLFELMQLKNLLGDLEIKMHDLANEITCVKNTLNKLIHEKTVNTNVVCINCDVCSIKK